MTGNGSDRVRFGPFEVDLHTHELWKYGTRIRLVGQPFKILAMLLRRPGELVTREELRSRLWPGDTFVDFNHGLNAAVNKLREALSDSAESPRYIETLPRRGYRFVGSLEPLIASATRPATTSQIEHSAVMPPKVPEFAGLSLNLKNEAEIPNSQGPDTHRWPRYLVRAGAALILLSAGVLLWKTVSERGQGSQPSRPMERLRPLTMPIESSGGPAFSPDGNYVAFERRGAKPGDAGIFVKATESDQTMQLTSNDGDCCPVWSPDGRSIAFSHFANKGFAIYVVASDIGGEQKQEAERKDAEKKLITQAAAYVVVPAHTGERKLGTSDVTPRHGELDWSPDGKSIVFTRESGMLLLSLEDSTLHRLTSPPPLAQDWGPSFSPDGQKLLFVREHEVGLPNEIMVASATGGNATRMLSEPGQIEGPPQWSFDGRSVIFSSNRNGHPGLWRVSVDSPHSPVQISDPAIPAWSPAVSRRGYRLAYTRQTRSLSIWQMDLSNSDRQPHVLVPSTSQTDQGPGPQYSPDGKKLAYMSDRSGTMEIWVSNRDGSNPFQLTAVAGAGTPRWSPDGQAVVFDAYNTIVSIQLGGGAPKVLMHDSFKNLCPSWSRDGKWIYFASTRSGTFQVWKVPAEGGSPVQVTRQGGHAALESLDGKYVYYAKHSMADPEIWEVPVDGGLETPLPLVRPGTWASWQVVKQGILFVGPSLGHKAALSFFDFAKRRTSTIAVLDLVPFWLGATEDGQFVAFDQPGREQAQIMLVENFR